MSLNTRKLLMAASLMLAFQPAVTITAPSDADDKMAAWEAHQALEAASPFKGLKWRSVGPIVQGGRVVDVESVAGDPHRFYVAYASGGLWHTRNNGFTFEPLTDQLSTTIMGDIAVDPNNPDVLWIGSGENNSSRSSYGGMGVFKSTDTGKTWTNVGLGDTDRIGRIRIDPRDSDRVYVASAGKLYTPGGQRGIYRTTDGGKTWKEVLKGGKETGFIELVMHPKKPDILYAASWERSRTPWNFVEGGEGSAIWKTTDGGDTWEKIVNGIPQHAEVGRIGLTISLSNPDVLYASVDNQAPLDADEQLMGGPLSAKRLQNMSKETFLAHGEQMIEGFIQGNDLDTDLDAKTLIKMLESNELTMEQLRAELSDANANLFNREIKGLEIYRTNDGGATWNKTHEGPVRDVVYSYGYYFGQLEVDPKNTEKLYVLGVPLVTSDDGGKTFYGINHPTVHVDHQSFWIDPNYPNRVITGNDGGIDISYDYGKTFRKMDAQAVGQFYTIAVDMAQPYNIYGGKQDNGTLKGSSRSNPEDGESWIRINGGDGMYVNIDPRDSKTVYSGYQFGFYMRMDPDGSRTNVRPRDKLGEPSLRYNWNTPVRLSKHNPDIVYFGANKLFRSMDKGEHWDAISGDLTTSQKRGDVPFATITTIDESPLKFGHIWVGTDDGHVHVTKDGGVNWDRVSGRLPDDRWVSRVVASRIDVNRAYVTLNGYRNDDITAYVYRTDNNGKNWKDISKGLPEEAVNVIVEDPVNDNILYVGTDRGVYVSLDTGASWSSLQAGLPNVPVHDLVVHPRDRELVAGTHGRSAWVVDVLPLQEYTAEVSAKDLHVFPAKDLQYSRRYQRTPNQWFFTPDDIPSHEVYFHAKAAGNGSYEVLDSKGRVLKEESFDISKGINYLKWTIDVNSKAALASEVSDNDGAVDVNDPAVLVKNEYHMAKVYDYPFYLKPGDYTLRINQGEMQSEIGFKMKPPRPLKPRRNKDTGLREKEPES